MRRTKIVATLGPGTEDEAVLRAVVAGGTDVVRLNGAHGTAGAHARAAERGRAAADELGRNLGVLVDLPGPKLRIGSVPGDAVALEAGESFSLASAGEPAAVPGVTTNVPGIDALVDVGDTVWLADGQILLEVRKVGSDRVMTEVVRGGTLRSRKGLAVPGAEGVLDPFTPADQEILGLAQRIGAELVAVSFVRAAADVTRVREALDDAPVRPLLVAKIETSQALDRIDEIVAVADAVMVARGDLAMQVGVARTPLAQKEIIALCNRAGRPVITATQMLESMTRSPVPTRAEASDVVNAVLDGTDALMLSEETAVGVQPADAVVTMARLALAAESWRPVERAPAAAASADATVAAVARASLEATAASRAAAILCCTAAGVTARRIAALRPNVPIVAVTESRTAAAALALVWGVVAVTAAGPLDDPQSCVAAARAADAVAAGDLVTVVTNPDPDESDPTASVHVLRA